MIEHSEAIDNFKLVSFAFLDIDGQNANSNVALTSVQRDKTINIENTNSDLNKFGDTINVDNQP